MRNQICDGFYDAGAFKPNSVLPTLEQYCSDPLNKGRAILLVNANKE